MRESKFRGMSLNGWVYGCYLIIEQGAAPAESCIWHIGNNEGIPVEIESVGQFTGLHDKNGKEIYKGDIVNYTLQGMHSSHFKETYHTNPVEFSEAAFWLDGVLLSHILEEDNELEIVGNIFENLELLEGETECQN